MSHPHQLLGRSDDELLWFRRRSVLQAAAAWTLGGTGLHRAWAQDAGNIVELRGDALRNGRPLSAGDRIVAGDRVETGPGAQLVFATGNSAFLVRQNTQAELVGEHPAVVRVLRLITGAVASTWGRGPSRKVELPTMTAGIRGTGVYAEVFPQQAMRGYFCNCYGTVDVAAGGEKRLSQADYHQAFWGEVTPREGRLLTPARAINHTDEELEFLAALIQQQTRWQVLGRKGNRDGSGDAY